MWSGDEEEGRGDGGEGGVAVGRIRLKLPLTGCLVLNLPNCYQQECLVGNLSDILNHQQRISFQQRSYQLFQQQSYQSYHPSVKFLNFVGEEGNNLASSWSNYGGGWGVCEQIWLWGETLTMRLSGVTSNLKHCETDKVPPHTRRRAAVKSLICLSHTSQTCFWVRDQESLTSRETALSLALHSSFFSSQNIIMYISHAQGPLSSQFLSLLFCSFSGCTNFSNPLYISSTTPYILEHSFKAHSYMYLHNNKL